MSRLTAAVGVGSDVNIFFFFFITENTVNGSGSSAARWRSRFICTPKRTMEHFKIVLGTNMTGLGYDLNVGIVCLLFKRWTWNCRTCREFAGIPRVVDDSFGFLTVAVAALLCCFFWFDSKFLFLYFSFGFSLGCWPRNVGSPVQHYLCNLSIGFKLRLRWLLLLIVN